MKSIIENIFPIVCISLLSTIGGLVFYVQELEGNFINMKSKGFLRRGVILRQRLKIMLSYVAILVCILILGFSLVTVMY